VVPFDRLNGRARTALAAAQEAAQTAGVDIEPEHLLLGVVHERDGLGGKVLKRLGVAPEKLDRHLGPSTQPRAVAAGWTATPTAAVRRVMELAFEEATLIRHREVGTEHLLLGILSEGTSRGVMALTALGVSLERVRHEIRVLATLASARAPITPRALEAAPDIEIGNSPDVDSVLYEAMRIARQEMALAVRLDHLLLAIHSRPDGRAMLRWLGLDTTALKGLAPPPNVVDAQRRVRQLQATHDVLAERARTVAEQAINDWVRTWWDRRESPTQPT
jgi:ATP-dependent Clp protease ATP-binding subunit ClpA